MPADACQALFLAGDFLCREWPQRDTQQITDGHTELSFAGRRAGQQAVGKVAHQVHRLRAARHKARQRVIRGAAELGFEQGFDTRPLLGLGVLRT